jgi:hypothetical protein
MGMSRYVVSVQRGKWRSRARWGEDVYERQASHDPEFLLGRNKRRRTLSDEISPIELLSSLGLECCAV